MNPHDDDNEDDGANEELSFSRPHVQRMILHDLQRGGDHESDSDEDGDTPSEFDEDDDEDDDDEGEYGADDSELEELDSYADDEYDEYDESDDGEDDEFDDDEDDEFDGFSGGDVYQAVMRAVMDERMNGGHDNEDDDVGDDDDDEAHECDCPECWLERNVHEPCRNDDDDDDPPVDENAPTCAICMEAESRRRTMVVLPCCGDRAEHTSTMRFCRPCMCRCLVKRGGDGWLTTGPCPRCARLISLDRSAHEVIAATPQEMLEYALHRTDHGGEFLVLTAWGLCRNLPLQYWPGAAEEADVVRKWETWGLLVQTSPLRYTLTISQREMQEWVAYRLRPVEDDDDSVGLGLMLLRGFARRSCHDQEDKIMYKQCFFTALHCFATVWPVLKTTPWKHGVFLAVRLIDRGLTLLGVGALGILPPPAQWNAAAPYVAMTLNGVVVFVLFKCLIQLFWVAAYGVGALMAAKTAGFLMGPNVTARTQSLGRTCRDALRRFRQKITARHVLVGTVLGYGVYYAGALVANGWGKHKS